MVRAQHIDSSLIAYWLSCFWPGVNAGYQIGVSGAIEEGRNVTSQLAYEPLASRSDLLAELARALVRECVINPGSKPSGFVGAGKLHMYSLVSLAVNHFELCFDNRTLLNRVEQQLQDFSALLDVITYSSVHIKMDAFPEKLGSNEWHLLNQGTLSSYSQQHNGFRISNRFLISYFHLVMHLKLI